MVKKIIILIILIMLVAMPIAQITFCDSSGSYYLIKENTYMIVITTTSITLSGNISLTASWYVRATNEPDVNENGVLFKIVEYNGIKGKVEASKLSTKSAQITTPPYYTTNFATKSNGAKIVLYKDSVAIEPSRSINAEHALIFLARSYMTDTLTYLVSYTISGQTNYSFIESINTTNSDVVISNNANAIDPDKSGVDGGNGNTLTPPKGEIGEKEGANITRIILIVTICVLAVLIVFLIFKPSKSTASKDDYYDA